MVFFYVIVCVCVCFLLMKRQAMTFCFVNFTYTQICSFVYGIFLFSFLFPPFLPLSLYVPRRAGVPAQS